MRQPFGVWPAVAVVPLTVGTDWVSDPPVPPPPTAILPEAQVAVAAPLFKLWSDIGLLLTATLQPQMW